ncbi:sigma 54-interacting transcriptional regulator [Geomesophilobacter sediminis]|uniref:Sigma-54-dependent Fis family transcriptional regulator n=1 Tax=Geomesophilobacter sediminis TaxID=2798584 RepID=A0A8J7IYH9_9BACT|nr:sigma 54-interacting transcriptional regulator [Geomesophilobacter sediminis]MBJ6725237.1 sigma-54-dependent Fis family transcriptional regulator [Geomesophilobacter sediminis]
MEETLAEIERRLLPGIFQQIDQVAPRNTPVLLLGEAGTGQGMVAHAIHEISARRTRPLIQVNCASLPPDMMEGELFGREHDGTGVRQPGRLEAADRATIFLDEIGAMPWALQDKMHRFIRDGALPRPGISRNSKLDVRFIAASNRKLAEEVRLGRFREELFRMLSVDTITLPPLNQRKKDLPSLVDYFVAKFNRKYGKNIRVISEETRDAFQRYRWPGNLLELESVVERAVIISQGSTLQVANWFAGCAATEAPAGLEVKVLADLEHDWILQALGKTDWHIEGNNGAAAHLGLNPSTLRARMRKYGIFRREGKTR